MPTTETALAVPQSQGALTQWVDITPEQRNLIKKTLMPSSASDSELELFLMYCNHMRLSPFRREIHATFRKTKEKDDQGKDKWINKLVIQVGIDGYRVLAERSRLYGGQEGPFWSDGQLYPVLTKDDYTYLATLTDPAEKASFIESRPKDYRWLEAWGDIVEEFEIKDDKGEVTGKGKRLRPPSLAKVGIRRIGWDRIVWGTAKWDECAQYTSDGALNSQWATRGAHMLAKCAESYGIRRALPNETTLPYIAPQQLRAPVAQIAPVHIKAIESNGHAPVNGHESTANNSKQSQPDDYTPSGTAIEYASDTVLFKKLVKKAEMKWVDLLGLVNAARGRNYSTDETAPAKWTDVNTIDAAWMADHLLDQVGPA